ncbi:VOC family protein [Caulobacter sp. 17J80-11]|uniref:VOC family protein n=1 Tax=Caulobacter sp. 17J80-11 TaxID=2763502 RepID=UPI0016539558|nr:VOC family protein [Caulobacter sp. 17J80-11]MBC6981310.1 VOC family protein [Caulobacter sp. 17J80-11]
MTRIRPFLMFEGRAEEAMTFYVAQFGGRVVDVVRYGPGQPGPEGTVMKALFEIAGQQVMCSDSFVKHAFTFTPSLSMFVDVGDAAEIERLAGALAEGGGVLMPLGDYGFSKRFAWVADRFGVSWQLNLA